MRYIAIFIFITVFFQTERYYVTFVKGKAVSARTGKPIKIGDAMESSDKLVFDNTKSKVVCLSPGKGRFEISPAQKKSVSGELWVIVKNNIIPALNNYHFSTRGIGFAGYDPATYFQCPETANRILLISDQVLPITASYKKDAANFFFLQYYVQGKRVTQRVDQNDTGIWFNLQTFSAASASDLPAKVSLCYQSAETDKAKSVAIAEFVPALLTKEDLQQQARVIKTYAGTTDQKKLRTEVAAHLYDNYGKIGDAELTALLQ